jgi:hypothetical protein
VSGTNSNSSPISYTVLPTSSPSWVPTPSSYSTPSGWVSYEYIPTSSGWETATYDYETNASGFPVTYISIPTPDGYSSYEYSTYTGINSSGETVTYGTETLSDGSTV